MRSKKSNAELIAAVAPRYGATPEEINRITGIVDVIRKFPPSEWNESDLRALAKRLGIPYLLVMFMLRGDATYFDVEELNGNLAAMMVLLRHRGAERQASLRSVLPPQAFEE